MNSETMLSIMTDELHVNDVRATLAVIAEHGLKFVDLRGRCFGKAFSALDRDEMHALKGLLDRFGLKVAALESSFAKVHFPDSDRLALEKEKLEGIVRAAEIFDCQLVRAFFFWQPPKEQQGTLNSNTAERARVLEMFAPFARRAREAGLTLAFENCGVTVNEAGAVLDELDCPEWGLAWDVANEWDEAPERKADEARYVAACAKRSRIVHVKARGVVEGTRPSIPYDRVLSGLIEAGYEGPVTIETHNADSKVNSVDQSLKILERLRACWPGA